MTTKCPSLPGQPVNVLQVPIILPDSRSHGRDGSVSSQKSNYRTMNPEDKYLNPRQPPKPRARLRTSPTLPQQPEWLFKGFLHGVTGKAVSQPASPTLGKSDGGRDGSNSKAARSLSSPRFRNLRPSSPGTETCNRRCFNITTPSQQHMHHLPKSSSRGKDQHLTPRQSENRPELTSSAGSEGTPPSTGSLPFRQPTPAGSAGSTQLSIQHRRAMKTKQRDDSPNGKDLRLEAQTANGKPRSKHPEATKRSPTAKIARKGSSLLLSTAKKLGTASPKLANPKEKRLPSLPNSPSSVMDEALRDLDDQERSLDMEMLRSHFSDTTTTDGSVASDSPCEKSHFSKWSTDSETASPESMTSASTFNVENGASPTCDDSESGRPSKTPVPRDYHDPQTPHLAAVSKPPSPASGEGTSSLDLSLPHLSISGSSPQLDIPGICVDDADQVESNPKRHATLFAATEPINALGLRSPDDPGLAVDFDKTRDRTSNTQAGRRSSTMLDLMDELSYLGSTIESGTGGMI
jgi:hypothetical protein